MRQKLKSFLVNDSYFTVLLLLLVGIGSFGLGRLSVTETQLSASASKSQTNNLTVTQSAPVTASSSALAIPVVASKSGTKYHLFDCPGAKQMKEENRIEFASIESARAAGYTPAGNCPGL